MSDDLKQALPADKRTSINVRKVSKERFNAMRGRIPEWQFFDRVLDVYEQHLAEAEAKEGEPNALAA